jgi:hypothetical protein
MLSRQLHRSSFMSRQDILLSRSRGTTRIAAGFTPIAYEAETPFLVKLSQI